MSRIGSWNYSHWRSYSKFCFTDTAIIIVPFKKSILIQRKNTQQHYHERILASSYNIQTVYPSVLRNHCHNSGNVNPAQRCNCTSPVRSTFPFPVVAGALERPASKAEGVLVIQGREDKSQFSKQGASFSVLS